MDSTEAVELATEIVEEAEAAKPAIIIVGVSAVVLGFGLGAFSGYKWAKKKLQTQYDEILEKEIAEAKQFYSRLNKSGPLSTPESAVQELRPEVAEAAEALTRYQGITPAEPEEPETSVEVEVNNIFTDSKSSIPWDWEAERASRNPEEPYVIHVDEYMEAGNGYSQTTLTWYEADSTLADERDEAIPTIDDVVGLGNMERFGHGCEDSRTVFIRNERLRSDYEVLKSDGSFAREVLGFQHGEYLASRDHRARPGFRG